MNGDIETTVVGNLADAPELRFTPSGAAVAKMSIAVTPRKRQDDKFVDGATTWVRGTVWRELAEHCAESLPKGCRVIAQGLLSEREYEKDGEKRRVWEFEIRAIGPELTFATTVVTRTTSGGGGGGGNRPPEDWGDATSKERPAQAPPAQQRPAQNAQRAQPAAQAAAAPAVTVADDPWA